MVTATEVVCERQQLYIEMSQRVDPAVSDVLYLDSTRYKILDVELPLDIFNIRLHTI